MATERVIICYRNWASRPDVSWSLGSWEPTLPLANLGTQQPGKVARSTGTYQTESRFVADLGQRQPLRVYGLINHNLGQNSTIRFRAGNTLASDGTVEAEYDSGWIYAWPEVVEFGSQDWGVFNWGQTFDPEEEGLIYPYAIHVADAVGVYQYVQVDFNDDDNPDGYIQIGVFYVDAGWQPEVNFDYGVEYGHEDDTTEIVSKGGQRWFDEGSVRRTISFNLQWITQNEALNEADIMDRIAKSANAVLIIPNPGDDAYVARKTVYGTLTKPLGRLKHWDVNLYSKGIAAEELI